MPYKSTGRHELGHSGESCLLPLPSSPRSCPVLDCSLEGCPALVQYSSAEFEMQMSNLHPAPAATPETIFSLHHTLHVCVLAPMQAPAAPRYIYQPLKTAAWRLSRGSYSCHPKVNVQPSHGRMGTQEGISSLRNVVSVEPCAGGCSTPVQPPRGGFSCRLPIAGVHLRRPSALR